MAGVRAANIGITLKTTMKAVRSLRLLLTAALRAATGVMKYPRVVDGKGLELKPHPRITNAFELLKFMCCDCGLVHTMAFAIEKNGSLGISMKRNTRATAAARRAKRTTK